jgi:hypothetical protein
MRQGGGTAFSGLGTAPSMVQQEDQHGMGSTPEPDWAFSFEIPEEAF